MRPRALVDRLSCPPTEAYNPARPGSGFSVLETFPVRSRQWQKLPCVAISLSVPCPFVLSAPACVGRNDTRGGTTDIPQTGGQEMESSQPPASPGHDEQHYPVSFVVIPARLGSTRLPRKMLLRDTGKTLIQHTYEAALRAKLPSGVCVATDSEEILSEVRSFGGNAQMTDQNAPSGTDRVAEVARRLQGVDIVVNLQGDEPEMPGEAIDLVIDLLAAKPDAVMATLATPIRRREQLENPACVKVVFDTSGRALYFSRSPIPFPRQWDDRLLHATPPLFYLHMGLYAYRRSFLLELTTRLEPSRLEKTEKLEQLRVLEAGFSILVGTIDTHTEGIDTPEDYQRFVHRQQTG